MAVFLSLIFAHVFLALWLVVVLAPDARLRLPLTVGFTVWLAAAIAISRTAMFRDPAAAGTPAFAPALFVAPLLIGLIVLTSRWTPLRDALERVPAAALLAPQVLRAGYGLMLLALGAQGELPEAFAHPAGRGDLIVGGTALVAAWLAGRGLAGRRAAMVWNVLAALELVGVLARGATTLLPWAIAQHQPLVIGTLPLFAVPIFLALHILAGRKLLETRGA